MYFLAKLPVRFHIINIYTNYFYVSFQKQIFLQMVIFKLFGANTGIIFWVKYNQDIFIKIFVKVEKISILIFQPEILNFLANHYKPNSSLFSFIASMQNWICSSNGTPSSSVPLNISSLLTDFANALSFSFFLTDFTSTSSIVLFGLT